MNASHFSTSLIRTAGISALLAIGTLSALFFIEGVPARFATNETHAWQCEDMSVSAASITAGESTTLTWHFAADDDVQVTIDGIEGESWSGVSGSTNVSPTTSTSYTARAHKYGTDDTYTCSVWVEVHEPEPIEDCDAISLALDDTSFTWSGDPEMTHYEVTYCDDTTTIVDGCYLSDTPISFATRIKSVTATGGSCRKEAAQSCPSITPHTAPTCTLNVSSSKVSRDSQVTLSWDSDGATSATIDQGIGAISLDGSQTVNVPGNTTYTGTFTSDHGESVTCIASVSVNGGGGKCLNCNDDKKPKDKPKDEPKDRDTDPSPKVLLSKTITKTGNYISLDQVPYTGFEAGPLLTTFFWLAVLAVSAGFAYVVTYIHPIALLQFAFKRNAEAKSEIQRTQHMSHVAEETLAAMSALDTVAAAPIVSMTLSTPSESSSAIEDRAHTDNILLSPEATRLISDHIVRTGTSEHEVIEQICAQARDTYPREDGWILLSKERAQTLLTRLGGTPTQAVATTDATPTHVMQTSQDRPIRSTPPVLSTHNSQPVTTPLHTREPAPTPIASTPSSAPIDGHEAHAQFVGHLVAGEQQKTFDLLRTMTGKGIAPETFIAQLVRILDDIYKNRLEGNHNPDPILAAKTATWSNGDFEKVLGILVECIDYSYSSTRIGTKVALAKAFEYFAQKNK